MKKQILAVCDPEREYVERFCNYVERKGEYPLTAAAFSSCESLKEFCKNESVTIALIEENCFDLSVQEAVKGEIVLLREEERKDTGARSSIYKYQSCEKVMGQVMALCAEQGMGGGFLQLRQSRLRMIGMYTPVHRCMQTTFAITLGELLARRHKVLYLNFESFSGLERRLDREFMTDMSDLIYYVANAREALVYKLKGMIETMQRLDYIPPVFSYMDLARISKEQWFFMLEELEKQTDYEYLILDLSDGMQGLFDILRMCEKIFTLVREDRTAAAKLDQYERLLERSDYRDVLEKTSRRKIPLIHRVPYAVQQLTYGELADYVRRVIKEEFYEE